MNSTERISQTGKENPIPDFPKDETKVALVSEHSQNRKEKALHPTVEDGQPLTQVTTGASGGHLEGSISAGILNGSVVILNFQSGCTKEILECIMRRLKDLESKRSSAHQSPAPVASKKHDSECGDVNTDERIAGVLIAKHEDGCEMTDDELYVHLHQCDVSDVSEEDIQSLTDEEVFNHVVDVLACCYITPSEEGYHSDTFGIKMRVKARQNTKKDPPSAETEETIPDVKLKYNIKGGNRSGNPVADLLDGVNSEKLMEDCTTAEGGQHQQNDVRSGKVGDGCSRADSGRKQLDTAYEETLMEDRSRVDSGQNAVYSEGLREGCTNGDNHIMKTDLLLPSPVDPLIGLPGNCVEFTFNLRCMLSRPVRFITRHNVEKTVEIGKLHPLENVQEVLTFLEAMLSELGPQSGIRLESGFYAGHPEVIKIDMRDIQNLIVRVKTKQNVELILQISAMKPPTACQRIETFLSRMLLKDC
ncbi:uncharacterized protein LOC124253302 isoform X1 [Haliotis rubra]|uniref:uncharacterized protein LOC124253302 isoform X1 n=2 Tax=Haliotis rubra TaxID=36100 RepID=UPI001EE4F0DD|nr:uncharacterized protein LOC124253302 isoform X1 [Haliotis rubra]